MEEPREDQFPKEPEAPVEEKAEGWQRGPNRQEKRFKVGIFGCVKCGRQGTLRNVGEVKLCERCISGSGLVTVAKMNQTTRKQRREMNRTMGKMVASGVITKKE